MKFIIDSPITIPFPPDQWDMGGCSINIFPSGNNVTHSHTNTDNFLTASYHVPEFHHRDGNVVRALYVPANPLMESVGVFFHCGHGRIDHTSSRVTFSLGVSGVNGIVSSRDMQLGSGDLRYCFWLACQSLCTTNPHSPGRTWTNSHRGIRMIFGFNNPTLDHPDYARNFWFEYFVNKKSLTYSWLSSGASIYLEGEPTAVAFGATLEEANNRIAKEKFCINLLGGLGTCDRVSGNSWSAMRQHPEAFLRKKNLRLPDELKVLTAKFPEIDESFIKKHLHQFFPDMDIPEEVVMDPFFNSFAITDESQSITFNVDGTYEVAFPKKDSKKSDNISNDSVISKGFQILEKYGINTGVDIKQDLISYQSKSNSFEETLESSKEEIEEVILHFRQYINNIPIITPRIGEITITFDTGGNLKRITNNLLYKYDLVKPLNDYSHLTGKAIPRAFDSEDMDKLLEIEYKRKIGRKIPPKYIPDKREVGYDFRTPNIGRIVVRDVGINPPEDEFQKPFWCIVTLLE